MDKHKQNEKMRIIRLVAENKTNGIKGKVLPSQEYLKSAFTYKKGKLINNKTGTSGFFIKKKGIYFQNILGNEYYVHRLVWVYFNGDIPEDQKIFHINGKRRDNTIENLLSDKRDTRPKMFKNNTTGYRGVSYEKNRRRYSAEITVNGKKHRLGRFYTASQAAHAYNEAAVKFHGAVAFQNVIK